MKTLAILFLLGAGARAAMPAESEWKLIAHRGGVVEDKFPDNSAAALHGAIARGYFGLEVDVRETKDGVLVMQHDADLALNFGDPRLIFETTWDELRLLRSKIAGQPIWRFEDLASAAREAGLWLMIDSKNPHSSDFADKLEDVLTRHEMLGRCLIIGTADAMDHFTGKASVGRKFRSLKPLLDANPEAKKHFFLFDEGRTLTEEMVRWAQALGVKVVPSINAYHYYDPATMSGKSRAEIAPIILAAARRHIEGLKALGVTEFQIDSEFDGWF